MKQYKITYETPKCKNCNFAVIAKSESEAWSKFMMAHIGEKFCNVQINQINNTNPAPDIEG